MKSLVGHEYERLVLLDGESSRRAKLVQAKRIDLAGKPVSGIEGIRVPIPKSTAVNCIGSTLQSDINY